MKRSISIITVSAVALAGCQAVPHAPVIYASKWSVGLVVEQAASDPLPTINLGVQIDDAAWIPAITCTTLTKEGKATDGPCLSRKVYADDKGSRRYDAFSVFGTFSSKPTVTGRKAATDNAAAVPLSAALTAGKVFATGVAAAQIASANSPSLYKTCIESVSKDILVSTTLEELNTALAICDVENYVKP